MNKWTRRAFITTGVLSSGVVIFGIAIRPGNRVPKVEKLVGGIDQTLLNIWLKISKDNVITAIIPHAEMGQGVHTTLCMMMADELDADWSKVHFEEAPGQKEYANYALVQGFLADGIEFPKFLTGTMEGVFLTAGKKFNLQVTGGSGSVRFTGMGAMRVAGAAARAMLLEAAASVWKVRVEELTVKNSIIYHTNTNRTAPYAQFAMQAAQLSAPVKPRLKAESEFRIMGTSPPRFDIPAKVNGTATFGIDVILPEMKYATIKASPVFGNKIKSLDTNALENMPGVYKVVDLENAVAVIADGYWIAKKALEKLSVEFEATGNENVQQDGIFAQYSRDLDTAASKGKFEKDFKKGNTDKAFGEASQIFEAEYQVPFLAHATMEPMNCTAWIHDGKCELWCGSQNPLGYASDVAELLEMDIDDVIIYNQFLGGGFGRRADTDVARQAVLIAKEVNFPVKLIWSREEDIRHDSYREASINRLRAGLSSDGQPIAWESQFLFKHHPGDATHIEYGIDNQLIHYINSQTHIPWGNWRSVDHSTHGFYIESFIDELAHSLNKDPLQYRRDLLANSPRFVKVLDMVKEKSSWDNTLPANWGRGVAIYPSFGTIVAEVVELEVGDEGQVRVHRVVCVADAGFAVHPDGFTAQMESGIVYGLSAALMGEITIQNGSVVQSNFTDYPVLRMHEMPKIETYIIDSGNRPGGAGEPSTPVIAPAIANAIFDVTGIRIRKIPVKNTDLRRENWIKPIVG